MRQLYQALLEDMHSAMQAFSSRRLMVYNQVMVVDSMFTQDKVFFGTHRLLMVEVAETNRLVRLGALPPPPPGRFSEAAGGAPK